MFKKKNIYKNIYPQKECICRKRIYIQMFKNKQKKNMKGCIENEWVKKVFYWRLPHLSIHWLIMRVGFEVKGSKPESSVNRLNLFKVLIVWSTSFLKGCTICSSDSSSSFSLSPSVITSAGCLENSEIIYSTNNGRDCLVSSRTCTSRNVLNGNFTVRSIFVELFQCFILCF